MTSQKYQDIRRHLAAAYDGSAAERDAKAVDLPDWKRLARADFLAALEQENKNTLLEIGSGPGRDALFFKENGLSVICTDNSPEMIRFCRAKGLEAQVADFFNLDFPPHSFDAVFSLNSLLHVPKSDLPAVLALIQQLLKPDGLFFFGTHGGDDFEGVYDEDYHQPPRFFALYSDHALHEMVEPYFETLHFKRLPFSDGEYHFQAFHLRPKQLQS